MVSPCGEAHHRSCVRSTQPAASFGQLQAAPDADIPLPNELQDRGYQSDDSHNVQDAGSDDEGEDLQEDAERC